LKTVLPDVTGKAAPVSAVVDDIDRQPRGQHAGIGADEL
jgi:hypothetical protein